MWKTYLKKLNFPESYVSITLGFLVIIVAGLLIYNNFTKTKKFEKELEQDITMEEKKQDVSTLLPLTHKVAQNENLWTIAEHYYKSGYNWVVIAKENKLVNPNNITVGQELTIPKAETLRPTGEKILTGAVAPSKTYTVIRGDNLWNIAVREYGDGFAWTKIAKANNLANPNLIHAGNILQLPE
uniref:LysM peptidoglycan-binding domain-containing protein n=1 Tax=candidate division CPR3 bacterium TaxID=2268181 RepID=A0A7C4M0Z0_UNCC3